MINIRYGYWTVLFNLGPILTLDTVPYYELDK